MSEPLRVCVDRERQPPEKGLRLALVKGSLWPAGMTIRIHFMDGDPGVHQRVATAAGEWMQHANIDLLFGAGPEAEVRISFAIGGSWSHVGTDALRVPHERPTLNLGWLTPATLEPELRRVVLHEFGHMLGCIHEHQNPAGGIPWNRQAVYDYYGGPPNNWDQQKIDHNVFETYAEDLTCHTSVDRDSIMMYPIPSAFTTNGYSVGLNTELSQQDKSFIAEMYPT